MTPLLRRRVAVVPEPDRAVRVYVWLRTCGLLLVAGRLALCVGDCQARELVHVPDSAGAKPLPMASGAPARDAG